MHAALLIDSIVRQTTVLIAALATASGQRAQLAHVANGVFADLVHELRQHGLGNKVIADMFGMALRTYRRKLARLSASRTEQDQSLWEGVLRYIQGHGPVLRGQILQRFARDDEAVLRSVLLDLAESGLVRRHGDGDATRFEAMEFDTGVPAGDALESLVLVALHRAGPLGAADLAQTIPAEGPELADILARLVHAGLVTVEVSDGHARYRCRSLVIGFGDEAGWEAAVFDHYQAMVAALVAKLHAGQRRADLGDLTGGSTFAFDLWEGHPMQDTVTGYLRVMREHGMALRRDLQMSKEQTPMPPDATPLRVVAYVGQSVTAGGDDDA